MLGSASATNLHTQGSGGGGGRQRWVGCVVPGGADSGQPAPWPSNQPSRPEQSSLGEHAEPLAAARPAAAAATVGAAAPGVCRYCSPRGRLLSCWPPGLQPPQAAPPRQHGLWGWRGGPAGPGADLGHRDHQATRQLHGCCWCNEVQQQQSPTLPLSKPNAGARCWCKPAASLVLYRSPGLALCSSQCMRAGHAACTQARAHRLPEIRPTPCLLFPPRPRICTHPKGEIMER